MTSELQVQENTLAVHPKAIATKTSLVIAEGTGPEEWSEIVTNLSRVEGAIHWWIGDAYAYADSRWGMYDSFLKIAPFAKQTVIKDKYIAESIESFRRRNDLSFGHHEAVASLDPDTQDYFLDMAVDEGLSVSQLRKVIKEYNIPKEGVVYLEMKGIGLTPAEELKIVKKVQDEMLSIEQAKTVAESISHATNPKTKDRLLVMPFSESEHDPEREGVEETWTVPAIIWADSPPVVSITSAVNNCIGTVRKGKFPVEGVPFVISKLEELMRELKDGQ